MAKVRAPLLSFGADGQIGQAQVYSSWRGRSYARRYTVPANPRTAGQLSTRNTFRWSARLWTQLGSDIRAPWTTQATGRPVLGVNLFTAAIIKNLRGKADLTDIVMSNGARGGFPATGISASPAMDGFDVTVTPPGVPSGWNVERIIVVAVEDQDPAANFSGIVGQGAASTAPWTVELRGLDASTLYSISGFVEYTKPDGKLAYGPALVTTETTSA